jgi:hypothetical protein
VRGNCQPSSFTRKSFEIKLKPTISVKYFNENKMKIIFDATDKNRITHLERKFEGKINYLETEIKHCFEQKRRRAEIGKRKNECESSGLSC